MAPSSGGFGGQALKRLNIGDAVHDGWTAFCRAPWSFVFFALLLTGVQILLQPLQEQVLRGARGETLGVLDWLLFLVAFTASLAVSCWGNVGMVRGAWRALAGERPTLGSLLRWDGPGFRRVFMAWIALSSLLSIPLLVVLGGARRGPRPGLAAGRGGLQITDASLGLPLLLMGLLVILLLGLLPALPVGGPLLGVLVGPFLGASLAQWLAARGAPGRAVLVGLAVVAGMLVSRLAQALLAVVGVVGFLGLTLGWLTT